MILLNPTTQELLLGVDYLVEAPRRHFGNLFNPKAGKWDRIYADSVLGRVINIDRPFLS